MAIEIRMLFSNDVGILRNVAPGAFDDPIDEKVTQEFLKDERHHLAVATDDAQVVGFISAVHYIHPDKPKPELWINEVQVAPTHRGRGLAKGMLEKILAKGRELGCTEAWVLTDEGNAPAKRLYSSVGGIEASRGARMFTFFIDAPEQG